MKILKEEEPLAFVVEQKFLDVTCSFCLTSSKPVRKCTGCQMLSYCNQKCQKGDWVNHKKECRFLKSAAEKTALGVDIRLAMRILMKSEEELADTAFNGRNWDSLDDNRNDVETRSDVALFELVSSVNILASFCVSQKKTNIAINDVTILYCKVLTNCLNIVHNQRCESVALGIYVGLEPFLELVKMISSLSVHKHSCIPNAQIIFDGARASLSSFSEPPVYSPDLTITYTYQMPWMPDRKKEFRKLYSRDCSCTLCIDLNHIMNRMGTSCRVDCCEDAAGILDESSTGPYKCNKCGRASRIKFHDVKRVEAKILSTTAKMLDPNFEMDLQKIRYLVQECERYLSIYNYQFSNLSGAVIAWTTKAKLEKEKLYKMTIYLFDKHMKALDYYLHDSDNRKTRSIVERALLKMSANYEDDFNLDRALLAAERTYGKRHREYLGLDLIITVHRAKIAAKVAEEYKTMCQYGY